MLTSTIGPGWGLAIDALGFAASAPLYLLIRVGAIASHETQSNILQDLRDGWKEFIARTWVWAIVVQFTIVNAAFSGMAMVLGPIVADETFGRTGWGLGVAAQSIGLIAGSLIALRWRPRRDLFIGVILVNFCALPLLALGIYPTTTALMAGFFLAGVSFGLFGVVWAQSLQTHIPPEKLARVYAYDALGSFVAIPVGEIAAGPLAQHYGSTPVLLACALAVVLATVAACFVPAIRLLDNSPQIRPNR
jgi:MFS family permease